MMVLYGGGRFDDRRAKITDFLKKDDEAGYRVASNLILTVL